MPIARKGRFTRPVRFRLTAAGWVFVVSSGLVGVVALNSRLALLFVMFGCMLGALYVSAVIARRMMAAVHVAREAPRRCWQNQPVTLSYLLRSAAGGGACLALRVQERGRKGDPAIPPAHCGYLPAREDRKGRCEIVPTRRGRIRLGSLRLSTVFPFGLVAARRQFDQSASLVVWPGRGRLRTPLLTGGEAERVAAAPSIRAGGQDEFYGLREYRPGDNPRWIHWRRSAGRDEPVIREMSHPQPKTLWVVLDTYVEGGCDEAAAVRERAIRFAATLIDDALVGGYRVGMALAYGKRVALLPPGSRRSQRGRLLDALADVDENTTWRLADVVGRLRPAVVGEAYVVAVEGAEAGAAGACDALVRLRRVSRSLAVVDAARLEEVFVDEGASAAGEGA